MGCFEREHAGFACDTHAALLPPMGQVASEDITEDDEVKCTLWRRMVQHSLAEWERMSQGVIIVGEGGDDEDDAPDKDNVDPQHADKDDTEEDYDDIASEEVGEAED
ncbi:uncharacterized protein MELLADRAFT_111474 [Melampsora larici-populina 98AG31]|uniref:Uncharacterized protein n=1 Tax=Melampsora larici-populina (strain 98AG31 / pathotype 3-4-7) TaxID=747676 RepID=F4S3A7_MELLP|nr:uncharacterized protein MELLADRAFT_111474 [Melampsora larici-populina 98AG31]EGG00784.1 hypothetical protein MELLADRAFT_111474 [Melampsora larici-populina 98AG31]